MKSARTKHLQRIRKQIRRMEARGYVFDDAFKESLSQKSTRSLAQLKTKGLYKRVSFEAVDVGTGEKVLVSGLTGKQLERKAAAQKAAETRKRRKREKPLYSEDIPDVSSEIIDNLDALLFKLSQPVSSMAQARDEHLFPKANALKNVSQGAKNQLQKILDRTIRELNSQGLNGEAIVAQRIYERSDELDQAIGIVEYSAYLGEIQTAVNTFYAIITGVSAADRSNIDASLSDALEEENGYWEEV